MKTLQTLAIASFACFAGLAHAESHECRRFASGQDRYTAALEARARQARTAPKVTWADVHKQFADQQLRAKIRATVATMPLDRDVDRLMFPRLWAERHGQGAGTSASSGANRFSGSTSSHGSRGPLSALQTNLMGR